MLRTFIISLIFSLQLFTPVFAADKGPMNSLEAGSRVDELIKGSWYMISGRSATWQYRITPPFPAVWPSDNEPRLLFYAYAVMIDPKKIADGEHIASPWASIELDPKAHGAQAIHIMKRNLLDLGVQGVRPISKSDAAVSKEMPTAQNALFTPSSEDDRTIKAPYCSWINSNTVIANQIEPKHQDFFDWLECRK